MLLEVSYKIIEKVIANRLQSVMDIIIHMDQKGFLKNRHISANIRKIFDIMKYADDMDIYLLNDPKSLDATFEVLEAFKRNSGFTVSYEKTTIYRIGSLRISDARLITQDQVNWTSESVKVLGVTVISDEVQYIKANYGPVLTQATNTLKTWSNKSISLIGKVCIVNTLIASLFVHKMMVLPNLTQEFLKQMEESIESFIWNGRKPKIPLKVLQMSKKSGGLKLVNLKRKEQALKLTWINIIKLDEQIANLAYCALCFDIKEEIWWCNLKHTDVDAMFPKCGNKFWLDVLKAWRIFQQARESHKPKALSMVQLRYKDCWETYLVS